MGHPDQLRQYARDCLRLSQDMTSRELKIHLINMAEAWAALASQSERIASLCATVPTTLEGVTSGPLAPESEPAQGRNGVRNGVQSPALSPDRPVRSATEPMAARNPDRDGDR